MKKFNQILLAVGLLSLVGSASATQIQGSIGFVGSYEINDSLNNVVSSFLVGDRVNILSANVSGVVSGDFAAEGITSGDAATYSDFIYDPVGPVAGIWNVGSFTFDLNNMVQDYKSSSILVLSGTGWINSTTPGLDQTFGIWNFSANTAGVNFTWSSSSAAPEPGIALLLGVGLIGLGVSRKLRKTA